MNGKRRLTGAMDDRKLLRGQRNNSIDIFRYIAAIMVVAIHTHPLEEVNSFAGYFFTEVFPRIAVPFFFAVAGYYYIGALSDGKKVFFKYVSKLLMVYLRWSCVYFFINFCTVIEKDGNIFLFFKQCATSFFITGSYPHLWFFPALIFSVCVITLVHKVGAIKYFFPITILLYIAGCLGCSYYKIGSGIPLLGELIRYTELFTLVRRVVLMGLPFFSMGYLLRRFEMIFMRWSNRKLFFSAAVIAIMYMAEIAIVVCWSLQDNIIITFMLYPLLYICMAILLKNGQWGSEELAHTLRGTANFTYYSHPIVILLCHIVTDTTGLIITQTFIFIIAYSVTSIIGFFIVKANKRWMNRWVM